MNATAKTLIAATLSAIGLTAFAQDPIGAAADYDAQRAAPVSQNSREQVRSDVISSTANGSFNRFEVRYENKAPVPSASPVLAKVQGEAANVARLQEAALTREQVRAAVLEARRNGQLNPFESLDNISYRPAVRSTAAPAALALSH